MFVCFGVFLCCYFIYWLAFCLFLFWWGFCLVVFFLIEKKIQQWGLLALHNCAQDDTQIKLEYFYGTPLVGVNILVGLPHVSINVLFFQKGQIICNRRRLSRDMKGRDLI